MANAVFGDTLPTPTIKINNAGQEDAGDGTPGPGYASVKIEGEYKTMSDQTNSGRLVSRSNGYHAWKVDITYNPMTRAEFNPVSAFLMEKQGKLRPFYVTLPQHAASQNPSFSSTLTFAGQTAAGATYFMVNGLAATSPPETPQPGDMFTITDTNNSNHKKAYMITRVETNADYNSVIGSQPGTTQLRVHVSPPLQRLTAANSTLVFTNPKLKVIMSNDVMSYQLKTDNLYVFSLSLEEVQ